MFFGYNGINTKLIMGVLIFLAIMSFAQMSSVQLISIILTLPAVIVAIAFHEFAHANAADKLGDTTPRNQGRLTLNPLAHLDPFGFILMLFAHIGWGKPVQINPNNFNTNKSKEFCEVMVSLAGPLMNFFLAIISCIIIVVLQTFLKSFCLSFIGQYLLIFLIILMNVNIGLGVFNLIPLPPLDGEKIFRNLLPYKIRMWLLNNYQTLSVIFMLLWFFGVLEIIVTPIINFITNLLITGVTYLIGFIK